MDGEAFGSEGRVGEVETKRLGELGSWKVLVEENINVEKVGWEGSGTKIRKENWLLACLWIEYMKSRN